ncbi:MAG: DUF2183 domain-containing protein [Microbacteriaceae bacterium]
MDKHLPPTHPERADGSHRASRIEDSLQSLRATQAVRRGQTPHVIPYTGYGSTTWMRVLARVLLLKPRKTKTGRHKKIRGWRSFLGIPLAGAVVTVKVNGSLFELEADRGGVIDQVIPVELTPGWHTVTLQSGTQSPVKARMWIVDPKATTGILCDVDDTIMVTALPRPLLAAWNSFARDENARRPVPGMAVLLERLTRENPKAPVIYLSTGAWNVAPTLQRFVSRHLYPMGTFLLTDWGPTRERWFRSGIEHKRTNLARLAEEFPSIAWILIGDDGQHDEKIYREFAAAHPRNVKAVAIRELLAPEALLAGGRRHLDRTANPLEIPWVSAPNGAGLASELGKLGIIAHDSANRF